EFLDPEGTRISYRIEDGRQSFRAVLSEGRPFSREVLAWADAFHEAYAVELSLTLPTRAVSVEPGVLSPAGTAANFSSRTNDLLKRAEAAVWTVRW
ncbi:MAG TPA: hypothetical protein VLH39_03130, partial [Magnetospirillaceae bacterium]|nr:hypothetical protein [Magnetospirillaceae bacterium]